MGAKRRLNIPILFISPIKFQTSNPSSIEELLIRIMLHAQIFLFTAYNKGGNHKSIFFKVT